MTADYEKYALVLFNSIQKKLIHFDQVSGCTGLVERPFLNEFSKAIVTGISIVNSGEKIYWDREQDLLFIANGRKIEIAYVNKLAFVPCSNIAVIDFEAIAERLWEQFDLRYVHTFLSMVKKDSGPTSLQENILQGLFPLLIDGRVYMRSNEFMYYAGDQICVAHCYWSCSVELGQNVIDFH